VSDASCRLRKITTALAATTIVGSGTCGAVVDHATGTSAQYNTMYGLAVDDADAYLYLADYLNDAVRLVDLATTAVTPFATASLSTGPVDVAIIGTAPSQMYVAAYGASNVDVFGVTDATPTASPTAPTLGVLGWVTSNSSCPAAFEGTGTQIACIGMAFQVVFDPSNGDVVVADYSFHVIVRISTEGHSSTWVGAAAAHAANQIEVDGQAHAAVFRKPIAVSVDSLGGAIVGTWVGHTVRRVTAAGYVSTIGGNATYRAYVEGTGAASRFSNPSSVFTDGTTAWVGDRSNNRIRKIVILSMVSSLLAGDGKAGFTDGPAANAKLNKPCGIAVSSGGAVYFADLGSVSLRKLESGEVTTIAGTGSGAGATPSGVGANMALGSVYNIAIDSNDYVYIATQGDNRVVMVDTNTNLATTLYTAGHTSGVNGVAVNAAGTRFAIASAAGGTVEHYGVAPPTATASPATPTMPAATWVAGNGSAATAAGARTAAALQHPYGMAWDPAVANGLVVATWDFVVHLSLDGHVAVFAGQPSGSYVAQSYTDGLTYAATFDKNGAVAVQADGTAFVGSFSGMVRKLSPGGTVSTFVGATTTAYLEGTGGAARLNQPTGVAVVGTDLVVSDRLNHRLRRAVLSTGVTSLAAGGATRGFSDGINARFNEPHEIAAAATGVLYLSDTANHAIRKVALGDAVSTVAGTGAWASTDGVGAWASLKTSYGLAIDGSGSYLIFTEQSSPGHVRSVDLSTTLVATIWTGTGGGPSGIEINADASRIFIADSNLHTVAAYMGTPSVTITPAPTRTASSLTPSREVTRTVSLTQSPATTAAATTAAPTTAAATLAVATTAAPNTTSAPTAAATPSASTASPGAAAVGNSNSLGSGSGAAAGAGGDCRVGGMQCYMFGLLIVACVAVVAAVVVVVANREPGASDKAVDAPPDDRLESATVVIDIADGLASANSQVADEGDIDLADGEASAKSQVADEDEV
jgi:hypothetical protein